MKCHDILGNISGLLETVRMQNEAMLYNIYQMRKTMTNNMEYLLRLAWMLA